MLNNVQRTAIAVINLDKHLLASTYQKRPLLLFTNSVIFLAYKKDFFKFKNKWAFLKKSEVNNYGLFGFEMYYKVAQG